MLFVALVLLVSPSIPRADISNPLLAVDTSSPRSTMRTFFELTDAWESAYLEGLADSNAAGRAAAQRVMLKLLRLLDLSEVPPSLHKNVGRETIVSLVDITRRIDVPALDSIPDAKAFPDATKSASWSIPNTEITIARMSEGTRKGAFLFNSETVARANEFYSLVKNLPLKRPARVQDWRDVELHSHGWMIPSHFVYRLPDILKRPVLDTPAWKVLGSFLVIVFTSIIVLLWYRLIRPRPFSHGPASYMHRLLTPLAMFVATYSASFFITNQINAIGTFDDVVNFAAVTVLYVAAAWAIWLAVFVVIEWVIASPAIPDQSFDANLLRLLGRVIGFVGVAMVAAYGAQQLGVHVLGIIAGLGVGGLAVALAAQSSIENLIGGLNLYADRPLRVGDFCEYGTTRGHVEHIGLRSTKIRSLDRTVTSVPNSQLAKTHITNYAYRDQMLFWHFLDLRYETTTEQLRFLVLSIREFLASHPRVRNDAAKPRVHIIGFGDWSIKVEVYAYIDTRQRPEFLAIQEELTLKIIDLVKDSGSDFAFPSQTTYIARDTRAGQERPPVGATAIEG
jgi:MscS family membrane protein